MIYFVVTNNGKLCFEIMKDNFFVILGNQLFDPKYLKNLGCDDVFMAEDLGLCTYVRHHKLKIFLYLTAMREYSDELTGKDIKVNYYKSSVSNKLKFYDYSKRIDLDFNLAKELNYHLTLSAGSLFDTLGTAIKYKLNYAGVLNGKKNAVMPSYIEINSIKFPVIDGDITDWRIGDNNDTTNIVGLRVKRTPNQTEEMRKAFCIA